MTRIAVTGGAGFVGSHVIDHLRRAIPAAQIVIFDKMTYAADWRNIADALAETSTRMIVGDVCDLDACLRATRGADLVLHLAAESHVDHSFGNSIAFSRTNTLGTHVVMEACRVNRVAKIIHVSTDEVYGSIEHGACAETAQLAPANPYAASKAAAEMIISGYRSSFDLPVIIVRANNMYGIRQYPEKIIPRFCVNLALGKRMPVHGEGQHVRTYLDVADFASAMSCVIERGAIGETYNIGTTEEYTNLQIATTIARCFGYGDTALAMVDFVPDRPQNDRRYSVDTSKIRSIGWTPAGVLADRIQNIAGWYVAHVNRWTSGPVDNVTT